MRCLRNKQQNSLNTRTETDTDTDSVTDTDTESEYWDIDPHTT